MSDRETPTTFCLTSKVRYHHVESDPEPEFGSQSESESDSESEIMDPPFETEVWKTELTDLHDRNKTQNENENKKPETPNRGFQILTFVEEVAFVAVTLVAVSELARYLGGILVCHALRALSHF